jgi:hypothetical protein
MKKLLLILPMFLAACVSAPMYGDCTNDNITPNCIKQNGGGGRPSNGGLSTGKASSPSVGTPGKPGESNGNIGGGKPGHGGGKPGHGHGDGNHGHSGPPGKGNGKGHGGHKGGKK